MFGIVVMQFLAVVEAAEHPVERTTMCRDQADLLVDLLAPVVGLVPAGEGGEQLVVVVEVQQQVGIVRARAVAHVGIGGGGDEIDDVRDIGVDFQAGQMGPAVDRLLVAGGVLVPAGAQHARAIGLRPIGAGALEGVSDDRLQILCGLDQQLVAGCESPFEIEILAPAQVLREFLARDAAGAARLRQGHARGLEQQRRVDEARIVVVSGRRTEGDMIAHQRDIDHPVRLIAEVLRMALGVEPSVRVSFPGVHVGAVGNVADRPGQGAQAVERALRAEQGFDARDVEQLEIVVKRDLAEVDAQGIVVAGAARGDVGGIEPAQHDRAGGAGAGVRDRKAGGEVGQVADVVDALAGQFLGADGGDVDRRVHDGRGPARAGDDDGVPGIGKIGAVLPRGLLLRAVLRPDGHGAGSGREDRRGQQRRPHIRAMCHVFPVLG